MAENMRRSETREISGVRSVSLRDYGEMFITQGTPESLCVEASPELLELIETKVVNGTLEVRIDATWLSKLSHAMSGLGQSPIVYRLTVPTLTGIHLHGAARIVVGPMKTDSLSLVLGGAGTIEASGLVADTLQADLRGAGNIEASGRATSQDVKLGGAGAYKAGDLESSRARVALSGAGEATVWAREELEATVRGLGNVRYYGPQAIRQTVTGLGKIVHLGER